MSSNFYEYPKGSKSVSMDVFMQNTTGGPATGIGFNAVGLKMYYRRPGALPVAVPLVSVSVTGAWASGGFVEIDATNQPGMYRIDAPDAIFAAGADKATLVISGAAFSPRAVGITLNGHVPTKHEGLARGGSLTTVTLAATASGSDNVYRDDFVDIIAGAGAGQSRFISGYVGATGVATVVPNFSVAPDTTSVAVVRSFGMDSIPADQLVNLIWDEALSKHLVPGSFGARFSISQSGVAQSGSATLLQLAATADVRDGFYNQQTIHAIAGAGAGQTARIAAYNGTTKNVTFVEPVTVPFDATTVYFIERTARQSLPQMSIDAILDAPIPRPTFVPAVWNIRSLMGWLGGLSIFKQLSNKTTGVVAVRDDNDLINIASTTVTDDGTTTTRSEMV